MNEGSGAALRSVDDPVFWSFAEFEAQLRRDVRDGAKVELNIRVPVAAKRLIAQESRRLGVPLSETLRQMVRAYAQGLLPGEVPDRG